LTARYHSEQEAKDDEPCGTFVPKDHASLGIDDVEDQGSDEAAEWDWIEKAIDALGNDGTAWFGTGTHGAATSLSMGLRKEVIRTLPYVSLQDESCTKYKSYIRRKLIPPFGDWQARAVVIS
jgi:hypothetical protein